MKKILLILVSLSFVVALNAQINKVALVSIYGNKQIDASDFGTVGAIKTLGHDPAFDLSGIITDVKDRIYNDLAKDFPFTMLEEDKLVGNEQYVQLAKETESKISKLFYICPEGYYFIPNTKKNIAALYDIFQPEGVDGFMYVSVDYSLHKVIQAMGFGTAKVSATITMWIYDKSGKKIFMMSVYQTSDESIKFALGGNAMEADKIIPLCEDATNKAFIRMKEKLPKKIAKMAKKVNKNK